MTLEVELAKIEAAVLHGAPRNYLELVDSLRVLVAQGAPSSVLARRALAIEAPAIEATLEAAAENASRWGLNDALEVIEGRARMVGLPPSQAVRELIDGIDKAGKDAVAQAKKLIGAGADPDAYLAPLYGHANAIRARATDVVSHAGNEGVTAIADEEGMPTVWVAETNACVHCLAYSGVVVKPGGSFPGGLTYGRKSYYPTKIKTPPRHPRCRCTVELLVNQEYADALRREADRSVLRGFSLESESMGVRIDAADRLVKKGVDAPKSVIAYSRKSIKEGKFPTRDRPAGGPTTPGKGPGFPPNKPKTPRPPTAPKTPKAPKPRPGGDPAEVAKIRAELEQARATAERYATFKSAAMRKHAKRMQAEVATLERRLEVELLGGATPGLNKLPKIKPAPIAAVVAKANPGRDVRLYDNNCSNAVVAAELRARGLSVIAAPRPGREGRYNTESAAAWRDAEGKVRPFTPELTKSDVIDIVESWPEGARGFVSQQWKMQRLGHIYTVEKRGGKAVFHEPQVPDKAVGGGEGYLDRAVHGKINLLRVDDLTPTDALLDYVQPDDAKLRAALAVKVAKKQAMRAELETLHTQYNQLAAKTRVLARTPEEQAHRLELLVELNALGKVHNDLRKRLMRL